MRTNTTNCQECGCSIFEGKQGRRKYCFDCAERRNKENERRYYERHQEENRIYQRRYKMAIKLQVTNK